MTINVLIADDHVFYREGVRAFLDNSPDINVVAEAGNGDEAVAKAAELEPDVILMDLKMPGTNGIDATRRIYESNPKIGVLVITMFDDDDSVFAAMRAGARGYLLKDADKDEVVRAIIAVERGEAIFSPAIARLMLDDYVKQRSGEPGVVDRYETLSDREREVFQLIAEGKTNKDIAALLFISPSTVETHRARILEKLDVHSAAEIVLYAVRRGVIR